MIVRPHKPLRGARQDAEGTSGAPNQLPGRQAQPIASQAHPSATPGVSAAIDLLAEGDAAARNKRPVYGRGVHRNRRDGSMNQLEKRYAVHLDERKSRGEILAWDFEPITFRIATTRATYTPDFRVMLPDGEIVFHEVKGGLFEAAAKLRVKVAADHHPHRFFVVRARLKRDGGGFEIQEV